MLEIIAVADGINRKMGQKATVMQSMANKLDRSIRRPIKK